MDFYYDSYFKNLIILKVSIYLKNWSYVLSYVNKVETALDVNDVGF